MTMMIKNFYFFTATVLEWKHVLKFDKFKDVIIESFKFLLEKVNEFSRLSYFLRVETYYSASLLFVKSLITQISFDLPF